MELDGKTLPFSALKFGRWKSEVLGVLSSVIFPFSQDNCEHVVLTETLNVTHLGYGQEHKKLFFIKNFMEPDFFSLLWPDPNPYFITWQMLEEFTLWDSPKCCMLKDAVLAM